MIDGQNPPGSSKIPIIENPGPHDSVFHPDAYSNQAGYLKEDAKFRLLHCHARVDICNSLNQTSVPVIKKADATARTTNFGRHSLFSRGAAWKHAADHPSGWGKQYGKKHFSGLFFRIAPNVAPIHCQE